MVRGLAASGTSRTTSTPSRIPTVFQGALDAGEQFAPADWLFDEIRSPGLHGLNSHRHVALAGDHDRRQPISLALEPPQQFEPTHAGHLGIDEEAPFAPRTIGFEERLGTGVDLYRPAILLEQIAYRLAHRAVIIDHEHGRTIAGRSGGLSGARLRGQPRLSEAALDQIRQLLRPRRIKNLVDAAITELCLA